MTKLRTLTRLDVEDFRCIESARLEGLGRLNVLFGHNGAGKTTVLEAIAMLASGNSFQAGRAGALIRHGADALLVRGRVDGADAGWFAVKKTRSETFVRHEGLAVSSAASLARRNPALVVTPDVIDLVRGGPVHRRRLLDRALFHVEHTYLDRVKAFHRAMVQRTALLRRGPPDAPQLSYWESQVAAAAVEIDRSRCAAVKSMSEQLSARGWPEGMPPLTLRYRRGWAEDSDLTSLLKASRESDAHTGKMQLGPHRAELDVRAAGAAARTMLSRGQARIVGIGLMLAQWAFITDETGCAPWLLIDDLGAELSEAYRGWVCQQLREVAAQSFVTVTDAELLLKHLPQGETALFHVKHGTVSLATEPTSGRG